MKQLDICVGVNFLESKQKIFKFWNVPWELHSVLAHFFVQSQKQIQIIKRRVKKIS